jgi:hypothetical protein
MGLLYMISSYERGVAVMSLGQDWRECRAMEQIDDPPLEWHGASLLYLDVTGVINTARPRQGLDIS